MAVRVRTGGRLHFGFCNLSVARERLYGSVGVALSEPSFSIRAAPAEGVTVDCSELRTAHVDGNPMDSPRVPTGGAGVVHVDAHAVEQTVAEYVRHAVQVCSVPGASVVVGGSMPRHVGLGSGTQLALATVRAVAAAYGESIDVRTLAPELGRGGRSGVGVAAFENGGFVVDDGHPAELFSSEPPAVGEWAVPPVVHQESIPAAWRFVLVRPSISAGRDGASEDASMRRVIERASPARADRLESILADEIVTAVESGDVERFGEAVERFNRTNGEWYTSEQGGVYRPPVGRIVESLSASPSVYGAGQSSWGPIVFGVTSADEAARARDAGERALDAAGVPGRVRVVSASNTGAAVEGDGA